MIYMFGHNAFVVVVLQYYSHAVSIITLRATYPPSPRVFFFGCPLMCWWVSCRLETRLISRENHINAIDLLGFSQVSIASCLWFKSFSEQNAIFFRSATIFRYTVTVEWSSLNLYPFLGISFFFFRAFSSCGLFLRWSPFNIPQTKTNVFGELWLTLRSSFTIWLTIGSAHRCNVA